eukprot:2346401-Pyramimonas_sp.AAC.1
MDSYNSPMCYTRASTAGAEEVKEYMDSYNSPMCYTNPKHRNTYGEFTAFVHRTGQPLFQGKRASKPPAE